jgi:hypothetical protein
MILEVLRVLKILNTPNRNLVFTANSTQLRGSFLTTFGLVDIGPTVTRARQRSG